jgi:two-component system, OmpR family, KDP operon response regulator KdpE
MQRILVVGERPEDAQALASRLGLLGYEAAPGGGEVSHALRALITFKPDAIVFDAEPGERSKEVFRLLERVSQLPIIVQGDDATGDEVVSYLDEGAVGYLSKPVTPTLLAARIASVLRRSPQQGDAGLITAGNVTLDLERRQVQKNGARVSLTPTEFKLLRTLAEHSGRPCSQKFLLQRVWGEDFANCTHYLRLYMGYLRQKLEDDPRKPRLLVTDWGHGYRLVADYGRALAPALQPAQAAVA